MLSWTHAGKKAGLVCSLFQIAEPRVQRRHRLVCVLDVTRIKVVNVSADLAATDLVRFGVVCIAGLEKLPVVLQRSFHLAHVTKTREFQRTFEITRLGVGFTECGKHTTELFVWSRMQIFVADEYAIGPTCEFREPCVHRFNDQNNAENRIAQHVRSEEHTSELQSHSDLVCRLLLEKKKNK